MDKRLKIVDKVNGILQPELTDCSVRLYGSSLSGFGLKTSDIDLDLVVDNKEFQSHIVLNRTLEVIRASNAFRYFN